MTLLIIVSVVAALLATGAYQLVIHKYYWGPKGQPKNKKRKIG
jgi:uncharacterized protein YdaU (DUF1376 family)